MRLMPEPDELLRELAVLATGLLGAVTPAGLDEAAHAVTAIAQHYFGAAACSVAQLDEETDELVYVAASGAGADAVVGVRLPVGRGIGGWVAQSGQPIAVSDVARDARFARDIAESTSYVPSAMLVVPIESDERLLGVFSILDRDDTRAGAARDLDLAAMFAAQAAVALQAAATFAGAGQALLGALAVAAGDNTPLADALDAAATARDDELAEFASVLAQFQRSTPQQRAFALRLLRDVLTFVNRTGGSSSPSR
jgi:GAF domain-containing protein